MVSDVLILGGGLSGASAALELARAGVRVRLLERETGPHQKICGEFLSIEARRDLDRLDVDLARLGAVPIDRIKVVRGERSVEASLPFVAQGVGRKRLDEALLDAARRAGAQVERGVRVTRLQEREVGTSAGPCRARNLFLATGKHDVRDAGRYGRGNPGDYVGFKMHWRLPPRQQAELAGAIELVLFDGGYAGLQPVSGDTANLCLIVRRGRLAQGGGAWQALLADLQREPHLARRLGDGEALFERPLAIANLPYGYVCDPALGGPGNLYRLGDQAALTAPLTGDGMAIALRSAKLAAECLQAGIPATEYHRRLGKMASPQIRRAMLLQRMTESPLAMRVALGLSGLRPALLRAAAGMTRLARDPA